MITAYSYVRFSSKPQERGDSLRRQTALARKYAAAHNLNLIEASYQDLGISAFKGRNVVEGALGAFLQAVDAGQIKRGSYLLVESMDRISRQQLDEALELFLSIIRRGITIVTLQDGQVYSTEKIKEDKGLSLIVSIMVMSRAHEESATKAKRVQEAWQAKREAGGILTGMGPSWLQLNRETKTWEVIPERAKTIKYIFQLALEGHGAPTIARQLNEERVPTLGKAEIWDFALVLYYLKHTAVIGRRTSPKANMPPAKAEYPPIISDEVFFSVNEKIKRRTNTGGSGKTGDSVANLFSGILYCECGARLKYVSSQKDRMYLQCQHSYAKAKTCDAPRIPHQELEKSVMEWLHQHVVLVDEDDDYEVGDPAAVINNEIATKEKQLERLVKAIETSSDEDIPLTSLVKRVGVVELELEALRKKLGSVLPTKNALRHSRWEARKLFRKHRDLAELAKTSGPEAKQAQRELTSMRVQLKSEVKRLLDRVVAVKQIIVVDDEGRITSTPPGPNSMTWGEVQLFGPMVEKAMKHVGPDFYDKLDRRAAKLRTLENGMATDDRSGVRWFYQHAAWGINGTRKRKV